MISTHVLIMILILELVPIIVAIYIGLFLLRDVCNKYIAAKDRDIKNKKYELYNNIDVSKVNTILDEYVTDYVNRYIVYKFMSQKIIYITPDDTTAMINDVTKNILIDISDLYIYYVGLLYSVDDQESLARFVKNKVMNSCINAVTSYNSTMVPEQ